MNLYLDNAATTDLSDSMKEYLTSLLDVWGNPSSLHKEGQKPAQLLRRARRSVAGLIGAGPEDIFFTPSGSAANTLAVKGLTSEDPRLNRHTVFYSPTSHKSMLKACESCISHTQLKVNTFGETDLAYLDNVLSQCGDKSPLVCVEAGNSEIGTINNVVKIGSLVHRHKGLLTVDATGYIPSYKVDMKSWQEYVDILTFSGHKLHALKGIGVLWKRKNIRLKPLIYGSQEQGLIGGTENVLGIASLGRAAEEYRYDNVSPAGRDYVYRYIMQNIPLSFPVGPPVESGNRLPHNLFMCFQAVEGESLMLLLDMHGIRVSTGSACNQKSLSPSAVLSAIHMNPDHIHSCIRFSFSGRETEEELNYVCSTLRQCVLTLRKLNTAYTIQSKDTHKDE